MNIDPTLLFSALAHGTRLRCLLLLLERGELCVCELTHVIGAAQPHVSRHLAHLREAGLVTDRREGTLIYYRLSNDHLATLLDQGKLAVEGVAGVSLPFEPVPVEKVANCPCPHCQEDG